MKNIDDVRLRNMEYFGLHEYIKYSNYQSIIEKVYSKWQKIIK